MKRGEIWTIQDHGYASKARPALIIQSDKIKDFDSIVLCLLSSFSSPTASNRVAVKPSETNGLNQHCYVMTDKIVTVNRAVLGERVGIIEPALMLEISKQIMRVLGL